MTGADSEVRDAVSPQIAFLMNRLLAGVITDGTGRAAASLALPLAGKTGTTDENTDAWFIGYSPQLVVGVWVGFDEPRSLGSRETGAQAALPIWLKLMETRHATTPVEDFASPPGIGLVAIDRKTGLRSLAEAGCEPVITEVFLAGTEPIEHCSAAQHRKLRLPHAFHHYAIDEQGRLAVPSDELDRLLALVPGVDLVDAGHALSAVDARGAFQVPLSLLPAGAGTASGEPLELAEATDEPGPPPRLIVLRRGQRPPRRSVDELAQGRSPAALAQP
jgi:membrane peptidoglycan carboxypeptidase